MRKGAAAIVRMPGCQASVPAKRGHSHRPLLRTGWLDTSAESAPKLDNDLSLVTDASSPLGALPRVEPLPLFRHPCTRRQLAHQLSQMTSLKCQLSAHTTDAYDDMIRTSDDELGRLAHNREAGYGDAKLLTGWPVDRAGNHHDLTLEARDRAAPRHRLVHEEAVALLASL